MKKFILTIVMLMIASIAFALSTSISPKTGVNGKSYEFKITVKTANNQNNQVIAVTFPETLPPPSLDAKSNAFISVNTKAKISSMSVLKNVITMHIVSIKKNTPIVISYGAKNKGGSGIKVLTGNYDFKIFIDGVESTIKLKVR